MKVLNENKDFNIILYNIAIFRTLASLERKNRVYDYVHISSLANYFIIIKSI